MFRKQYLLVRRARAFFLFLLACLLVSPESGGIAQGRPVESPAKSAVGLSPAGARRRLAEGNRRFLRSHPIPKNNLNRLRRLVHGQHPLAVVVCCSDSRVAPEVIFDEGLGDLFVVRVAGNVMGEDEIGSVEYAVLHLHAPLVLVLEHSDCGAVRAALGHLREGHITALAQAIEPALKDLAPRQPGDLPAVPAEAVSANVRYQLRRLEENSPELRRAVAQSQVAFLDGDLTTHPGPEKSHAFPKPRK